VAPSPHLILSHPEQQGPLRLPDQHGKFWRDRLVSAAGAVAASWPVQQERKKIFFLAPLDMFL